MQIWMKNFAKLSQAQVPAGLISIIIVNGIFCYH